MDKKRVLLLHSSIGSGHRVASYALTEVLHPKYEIKIIDVLEFFSGSKNIKINFQHPFLGPIYDFFWGKESSIPAYRHTFHFLKNKFSGLETIIHKYNPSIIISTHIWGAMLANEYAHAYKRAQVITDHRAAPFMRLSESNFFFVSNHLTQLDLMALGIPKHKIVVTGIPIRKQFMNTEKTKPSGKILLVLGGIENLKYFTSDNFTHQIEKLAENHHLEILCGSNTDLADRLKQIFNKNISVYTTLINMAEIINRVDLVITKPGGLITSECLALGKPMLFIGQGYGQERLNSKFVLNYGAALQAKSTSDISRKVEIFFNNDLYQEMSRNSMRLGKPNAAKLIADKISKLI